MDRRRFLAAAAAIVLLSTSAARANYIDDIVDWLAGTGFTDITLTQTLLGRILIHATLNGRVREIACNPRTGEILRDVWLDGRGVPPALPEELLDDHDGQDSDDDNSGQGGGDDSGSDDSGGDDNSGHGSSNSGKGSSNSGHGGGDDN